MASKGKPDLKSETGANQQSDYTTWRLATMSLAIRGIEADVGKKSVNCFVSRTPALSLLLA